jgi:flagellar basal body-associated protein FliL
MSGEKRGDMEKGSTSSAVIKSIVLVVLGAIVVLGLYFLFTRNKNTSNEETYTITVVDEITTTNLEKNYPASARKVVELYAKTMQVLYRETYTDDQRDKMIEVIQGLMDDELLANNPNFAQSIRNEVKERRQGDYSISAFVVQTKEPEEVTVDGRKMCNVDCLFNLRHASNGTTANYYQFVLRRESANGNWKILGWTIKEGE